MIYLRIKHNPKRYEYSDLAITPVTDEELETHEMFGNDAARAFAQSERRIQKIIRESVAAPESCELVEPGPIDAGNPLPRQI
jgi:hypothetical protein